MEQQKEVADNGIQLRRVKAEKVKFYKVLGGADATLQAYNVACQSAALDTLDGGDASKKVLDWKAMYTQFLAEHVLGTVPYRWERECTECVLIEATLRDGPLDVIVMQGNDLHDSSISGTAKALTIKRMLQMDPSVPLMEGLGRLGQAAMVKETRNEWELILPHDLLNRLRFEERRIVRFRRHPIFPVTQKWCWEGGPWQIWDDDCPQPFPI